MKKLKIGIYIAYSSMESGGIFVYANGLINMLLRDDRIERLVLFYSKDQTELVRKIAEKQSKVSLKLVNIHGQSISGRMVRLEEFSVTLNEVCHSRRLAGIMKFLHKLNPYRQLFENADIDLVHVPYQTAPIYGIRLPVIITMHDLQELHFPQYFSAQDRANRALLHKRAIEQADMIIVSVNHVKDDIIKYFKIPPDKVRVCPLPFAQEWFQDTTMIKPEVLAGKYGIPEHFILYPAMTWEHKNHLGLVNALGILRDQGMKINLVCTGKKTDYYASIEAKIKELGLEKQIYFLGLVPESDLISLYKSTDLVVLPTLYEAESQPFFEAMRYEAPVICSQVTSLPESVDDPEFMFDPCQEKEMADLIQKGCFDLEFRGRNLNNLKKRKAYYQGLNSSDNFLSAYTMVKCHDGRIGKE